MVTDGNQIYHGDHFEMYRNIESLCVIGTNIVSQVNYTSQTNKLIEKEIRLVVTRGKEQEGGVIEGMWSKVTNLQL